MNLVFQVLYFGSKVLNKSSSTMAVMILSTKTMHLMSLKPLQLPHKKKIHQIDLI